MPIRGGVTLKEQLAEELNGGEGESVLAITTLPERSFDRIGATVCCCMYLLVQRLLHGQGAIRSHRARERHVDMSV